MCRTTSLVVALAVSILAAPLHHVVRAASPEEVDAAIERAKEFIYKQQKDDKFEHQKMQEPWVQTGGHTALAVYALLAAGESHQDPRLAKAIDYLKKTESKGIYAVGVRCLVWHALPQTDDVKAAMKKDLNYLLANIIKDGRGKGFYDYMGGGKSYSHSRAQYAVLGVWAAAQSGLEVPRSYWDLVEKAWVADQQPDGGWAYQSPKDDKHGITPGMTAVGVATLFITQDYLHPNAGINCRGNIRNAPIDKGMGYMVANFDKIGTDERYHTYDFPFATLYAVERIGVASGQKYFGTNDWYQKGADWLVKVQTKSGANKGMWFAPKTLCTPLHDTCFGLLFLSRGRAAVAINKLEYTASDGKPANWNQRPRDVANLARWTGKAAERDLNWQIVNLQVPAKELHDAPILYMSGNQELSIPDDHKEKLKAYVEGGGMLLANADCGDAKFAASFRKLATELFPGYEFRELPENHPIYTNQQFLRERWKNKPSVLGLSNGVRELALLLPQADPAKAWQLQLVGGKEEFWQLGANIFQYAIDKQNIGFKGETHIITRDQKVKPQKTVRIARVEYAGNWNPEPGGWRRLADWMHNKENTDLDVKPVKLTKDKIDAKVVHLTGTTPFTLDPAQQVELRNVTNAGGTLVFDAAGGSSEFADSVEKLLPLLFPGQKLEPIPPEHPVFNVGTTKLGEVGYRTHARNSLAGSAKGPKLQGIEKDGRIVCFYSREDLSAGLVGQPVDGIIGYDPRTATEIMSKIILYAAK
ncbi:MAG TPA: DUF4159 domain-containing protein [Tepidisphaeraceae bacterium]|nr:DUF4159 domain-containing protein [Tepidisphaeraceae bacterium]